MFQFAYPSVLYLWGLIPIMIGVYLYASRTRRKQLQAFGEVALLDEWMPDCPVHKHTVKFLLVLIAFFFAVAGAAGPRYGTQLQEVKRRGSEIIIALDVSNSMMAQDIQPNRLERSKQAVSLLVDRLTDDKLGLIIFAGEAYTQLPITTDYVSAKMFLSSINPDLVAVQGTAIGSAIDLAMKSFSPDTEAGKTLIIITDGENHEDDPVSVARKAAERGITIHAVGVGSLQGTPIPKSASSNDYWKDGDGNVVVSKLDEKTLQEITAAAGGAYVRASAANMGLSTIFEEIQKADKVEYANKTYAEYAHVFQWVFAVVLILLFIDVMMSERRNRVKIFHLTMRNAKTVLILALCMGGSTVSLFGQTARQEIRRGNKLYEEQPAEAEIKYRKALELNPDSNEAAYNLNNSLFRQEKYGDAATGYKGVAEAMENPEDKARSLYNLGNAHIANQKLQESIEAYKAALRLNPSDMEAKYNLSYAQHLLDEQQQQQQQQQNQDGQQDQKDQQPQQPQQQQDQQQQQQDQNQNQQKEQDQQNNDSDMEEEQGEQPQPSEIQEQQISPEDAQRILEALQQDEQDLQEQMKKAQQQKGQRSIDKNW